MICRGEYGKVRRVPLLLKDGMPDNCSCADWDETHPPYVRHVCWGEMVAMKAFGTLSTVWAMLICHTCPVFC